MTVDSSIFLWFGSLGSSCLKLDPGYLVGGLYVPKCLDHSVYVRVKELYFPFEYSMPGLQVVGGKVPFCAEVVQECGVAFDPVGNFVVCEGCVVVVGNSSVCYHLTLYNIH